MIYLDEYSPLIPEDCRLSEAAPRATQALSSIDRFWTGCICTGCPYPYTDVDLVNK